MFDELRGWLLSDKVLSLMSLLSVVIAGFSSIASTYMMKRAKTAERYELEFRQWMERAKSNLAKSVNEKIPKAALHPERSDSESDKRS